MEELQEVELNEYQLKIRQAWDFFEADDNDSAKEVCDELIKKYPEKSGCHFLLAHVHRVCNRLQLAANEFLIAIKNEIDGLNVGYAYYWLGVIYNLRDWTDESNPAFIYDKETSEKYYRLAIGSQTYPSKALFHFKYSAKGQEKIELMEQGIAAFPDMPDFYVLLAEHYRNQEQPKLQIAALMRAKERNLSSPSLHYNLGQFYFNDQQYLIAFSFFERALSENEANSRNNYAIKYYLGRISELTGNYNEAEKYYLEIYQSEAGTPDLFFGLFGLITCYCATGEEGKLFDLIRHLDLNRELIVDTGNVFGRPVFLSEEVTDDICFVNLPEIHRVLNKLKLERKTSVLNGKIWLLRYCTAGQNNKYQDQYKSIKNAIDQLNVYHYPFVHELYAESISTLISYNSQTLSDKERIFQNLTTDLDVHPALANSLVPQLESLFELYFECKAYDKVVSLSRFFSSEQIAENNGLFELAYSYAELNDKIRAEKFYRLYLEKMGDNAAVLNNLGNILDSNGDYAGAIGLYQRGLVIDSKHKNLNSNIQISKGKLAAAEKKALKEQELEQEYKTAIAALAQENDFVIDKLTLFIDRAKQDPGFDNWELPVPKHNFPKYLSVNRQMADGLLTQWLKKQYLTDTKKRDGFNVVIYAINPFLEEAVKRLQKLKIPKLWIDKFIQISADHLDKKGYFDLIDRTEQMEEKYKKIFQRDLDELFFNYQLSHNKTTIVLSGSLVELALIYYCERKNISTIPVTVGSKVKNKALYSCVLNELIAFVEETKSFGNDFSHLTNLSRIYRNYVHPGKELEDGVDSSKADLCFISTLEILKRII